MKFSKPLLNLLAVATLAIQSSAIAQTATSSNSTGPEAAGQAAAPAGIPGDALRDAAKYFLEP